MIVIQRKGAFVLTALIKRGEGPQERCHVLGRTARCRWRTGLACRVVCTGTWRFICTVAYLGEGGKRTMADLREEAAEPIFFLLTGVH